MRKLAIFGLILLILVVVVVTLAVVNYAGFRDSSYTAIQGTILQPAHDWIVDMWVGVGTAGFTYIAAAILVIGVGGGLFLTLIVYGLFWQKLIQGKLLHKTVPSTTPLASMQRNLTTELSATNSPPPPETPSLPVEEKVEA